MTDPHADDSADSRDIQGPSDEAQQPADAESADAVASETPSASDDADIDAAIAALSDDEEGAELAEPDGEPDTGADDEPEADAEADAEPDTDEADDESEDDAEPDTDEPDAESDTEDDEELDAELDDEHDADDDSVEDADEDPALDYPDAEASDVSADPDDSVATDQADSADSDDELEPEPDVETASEPEQGSQEPVAVTEPEESKPRVAQDRLDMILGAIMWGLVVAIIGVGGWFGWSVYAQRQQEFAASPALRLIAGIEDQVRQAPNNVVLRVRLGEALGAAGKYREAVEQLENALKLDPNHTGAYLDLGTIAILEDDYAAARRYFLRVIELTEEDQFAGVNNRRELAFYNLGLIALDEKEYEEAIGYLKSALRIRRDASDTYYHLAKAFQGLGEYEAAYEQLEYALAFDPNYPEAHYVMGELYMAENDEINASYHFARSADLAPNAEPPQEAVATFGTAEERKANAEKAIEEGDVEKALHEALVYRNLALDSVPSVMFHAEVLVIRGDLKDALNVYNEALALAKSPDLTVDAVTIDVATVEAEIAKLEELIAQ